MAVLIEAISVVVRQPAIEATYPGKWESFRLRAPNATLCADDYLARAGFMQPSDAESFVNELAQHGLIYLENGAAKDLVVIDQQRGPAVPCSWIEFGRLELSPGQQVAACRATDDTKNVLATPDSWKYEGSLSQTVGFVPTGDEEKSLRFLRHESGIDVYLNEATGKEVFVGRTDKE